MEDIVQQLREGLSCEREEDALSLDLDVPHQSAWMLARESLRPASVSFTPGYWWGSAREEERSLRRQRTMHVMSSEALRSWISLSRVASGRGDAVDVMLNECAVLAGWRLGLRDSGLVLFQSVPDGSPAVREWWRKNEALWERTFGRVERKPSYSKENLMFALNKAVLDRYGMLVTPLSCARGWLLKNVHFLASWASSAGVGDDADYVNDIVDTMVNTQTRDWPPHDWFMTVDESAGLAIVRGVIRRLQQCVLTPVPACLSAAKRFLTTDNCIALDETYAFMDFFARGFLDELEVAYGKLSEARSLLVVLHALNRFAIETMCVPLYDRMRTCRRVEEKLVAPVRRMEEKFVAPVRRTEEKLVAPRVVPRAVDVVLRDELSEEQELLASRLVPSVVAAAPVRLSGGRSAVQSWLRGLRYDSITEAKVSLFLQELSREFGVGGEVQLDVKPGEVSLTPMLSMLRTRMGAVGALPSSLENARWFPDFNLCLNGLNYWVEVKYHASRIPLGEYEKYTVVSQADRPVLLIQVDGGCILPPYSTGKREYGAVPSTSSSNSSSGIVVTRFFGGRRCDCVFVEREDGRLDLVPCPENLSSIRQLNWGSVRLMSVYRSANEVVRRASENPESDSRSAEFSNVLMTRFSG